MPHSRRSIKQLLSFKNGYRYFRKKVKDKSVIKNEYTDNNV